MFEYGSRAGFWRLWRLFTTRKHPVTVFGVAAALARNPQIVAGDARGRLGHRQSRPALDRVQGFLARPRRRPYARGDPHSHRGDRRAARWAGTPAAHPNRRLKLVLEDGGFLYSSDSYADDLPYWVRGPKGPHLIIPYSLDANDMRFINPQGFPERRRVFQLSARHVRLSV